jgi:hypothetical protein
MSAFTQLPHKPYRSLWAALTLGCLVASVAVAVFSNLRGASSGVGFFFFVLYISFAIGAGVTLLVAMPLLWLLIRIGYAGPVSAIAFSCVLRDPAHMLRHPIPMTTIVANSGLRSL